MESLSDRVEETTEDLWLSMHGSLTTWFDLSSEQWDMIRLYLEIAVSRGLIVQAEFVRDDIERRTQRSKP